MKKSIFIGTLAVILAPQLWGRGIHVHAYRVTSVEGTAFSWEPWSDRWERLVKGAVLREGALIQVTDGGRIAVAVPQVAKGTDIGSGSSIVRFMAPAVVRLDEGFLRRIKLSSYFVPALPSGASEKEEQSEEAAAEKLLHTVDEAWKRFIAVLARVETKTLPPPRLPAEDKSGESEWVSKLKPLVVVYPTDRAIVVSDRLPALIKVLWKKPPGENLEYGVHLWRADEARKAPLGSTSLDYYTFQIPTEGRYFVQVSSMDGSWQSKAHSISIALPLTLTSRPTPFSKEIGEMAKTPIKPTPRFPVSDFVFLASMLPATVQFQWDYAEGTVAKEAKDTLVVVDAQGRERVRKVANGNNAALAFAGEGEYRWFVERRVGNAESFKMYSSEPRSFQVSLRKGNSLGLLTAQSRGVFYLEDR